MCDEVENLENPNYENLFIEKRENDDTCFTIMIKKLRKKKKIGILHQDECWDNKICSCHLLPTTSLPTTGKTALQDENGLLHMKVSRVINSITVDWDEVYLNLVGFCLLD